MALFFECTQRCAQNRLDRADIVRDGAIRADDDAGVIDSEGKRLKSARIGNRREGSAAQQETVESSAGLVIIGTDNVSGGVDIDGIGLGTTGAVEGGIGASNQCEPM
jgi:hypothetical protein